MRLNRGMWQKGQKQLIKMSKKEKKKYQVKDEECYDRECFIPFSGNGIKICRLYEMGQCPKNTKEKEVNK